MAETAEAPEPGGTCAKAGQEKNRRGVNVLSAEPESVACDLWPLRGSPCKKTPSSEPSWRLKDLRKIDHQVRACVSVNIDRGMCVTECVITSACYNSSERPPTMRELRGRVRMETAGKGHPPLHPDQSSSHRSCFSPLFQRYMLTVGVNVLLITECSIPGCQDVGVGHRGQM